MLILLIKKYVNLLYKNLKISILISLTDTLQAPEIQIH